MTHFTRRASVHDILENASAYEWTIDRPGVLRFSLSDTVELHIHDTESAGPGAMLAHGSDVESTVIAGELAICVWRVSVRVGSYFNRRLIEPGPGSNDAGAPDVVRLTAGREKTVAETGRCLQRAGEIYATRALRGTVTLVELKRRTDCKHVFWPAGEERDTPEPRPATDAEVAAIAVYALERWFAPQDGAADDPMPQLERESQPTGWHASGPTRQRTCPAPEPSATIDPRFHVLAAGMFEIEAGGPGGIVTWGVTGMRDRARKALEDAGLLSPSSRRRGEVEFGLQSALGQ